MDTNNQNIFGSLKSSSGTFTCGACFQEFASYNDLILHERLHIEQMSLAGLQAHLLPQCNNRAAAVATNFQSVSTNEQNDNHTIDALNHVLTDTDQTTEHVRSSPTIATGQEADVSQLDLRQTSAQFSNRINSLKEPVSPLTDTESPDLQAQKTHIELKTPTYIAVPYGRGFQQTKQSEKLGTQDVAGSYNINHIQSKVTCESPDIDTLQIEQDKFIAEPLYQGYITTIEKPTIATTKCDFTVSGIIQPVKQTTVYNMANTNKPVQLSNYESTVEKPLFEAIPFYYENVHVDGGNTTKKHGNDFSIQTLSNSKLNTLPTVIPASVGVILPLNVPNHSSVSNLSANETFTTHASQHPYVADYSIQTLSGNKSLAGGSVIPQVLPSNTNLQVLNEVQPNTAVAVSTLVQTSLADLNLQTARTSATTPTILPMAVSDYNKQPMIGNINQVNNVQLPISTIKQLPQYHYAFGAQQALTLPAVQVIEMPVSSKYFKPETMTSMVSPSSTVNSILPAYVQTTLSYIPPKSVNNILYQPDPQYVYPRVSPSANQAPVQGTENHVKNEMGCFSQSRYQFTAVPLSNCSSSSVEFTQTLSKCYSDSSTSLKSSVTMYPRAFTQPTAALPKQIVMTSSSPYKKQANQLNAVKLSDGTYYPGGLPFPKEIDKYAPDSVEKRTDYMNVKTVENERAANGTLDEIDESAKQKEFVDMIKIVQEQRGYKRKHFNEPSDSEHNNSDDYKVDIVCFICSAEFEKRKKLYKHLDKHRESGELSPEEETDDNDGERKQKKICKYCGRQFMRIPQLVDHIRKHTSEKPYQCRFCNNAYGNKLRCTRHEAMHNNDEVGLHCEICDTVMETKAFYLYHMNEHVLDETTKIEEEKQQKFVEMIRNVQSDKGIETEKAENTEDEMLNLLLDFEKDKEKSRLPNEESVIEAPEIVTCRICPEKVVKKEFLNHFKSHKIYICKVCKRGFTKKLNYKYHSDTMHFKEETIEQSSVKKSFVCSICEKRLSKYSKLKMHLQTHVSDEPLLKCEVCEDPFHNIGDYFYHISKHDDKDAAELVDREKEKSMTNSRKGLKIKISNSKVPNVKTLDGINGANESSDKRELRHRDKDKRTDYSWHGLVEDKLKTIARDGENRNKNHEKRNRKQVVRYAENVNESSARHKNMRKRKLLGYSVSDIEENSESDIPLEEGKGLISDNNKVKEPGEVEVRLSERMKCRVCNRTLTKLNYIEHFRSHFLLTCEECQRSFVKKKTYISHYKNVHETEISEEFVDKEFSKFQEIKLPKPKDKKETKMVTASELRGNKKVSEVVNRDKSDTGTQPQRLLPQEMKEASTKSENQQDSQKIGYMFELGTDNPFVCTRCNRRFSKQCGVTSHLRMHANADSHRQKIVESAMPYSTKRQKIVESGVSPSVKINTETVSKELSTSNENSNHVSSKIEPEIKYFCEICQKTITQRHNYETHMKAKHKSEMLKAKTDMKQKETNVENEPKIKVGIEVRSPPKKRKIFVDHVYDRGKTTSDTNHHISSESVVEQETKLLSAKGKKMEKILVSSTHVSGNTCSGSSDNDIVRNESDTVEKADNDIKGKKASLNKMNGKRKGQTDTGSKDGKSDGKESEPTKKLETSINDIKEVSLTQFNENTQAQTNTDCKNDKDDLNDVDPVEKIDILKANDHGEAILKVIVLSNSAFKTCPICFMKIYSTELYEKHLKSHTKTTFDSCKSCDLSFESQEQLYIHRKTHVKIKPNLNTNLEDSNDGSDCTKYVKETHQEPQTKLMDKNNVNKNSQDLVCRLCYANFMTKAAYDIHLQHHTDEENDADESNNDDDVENMIDNLEQCGDAELVFEDNRNRDPGKVSVDSVKQDAKVQCLNEKNGNFYFIDKQYDNQSVHKLHDALDYVTQNDYPKQYSEQGWRYNVKGQLMNEQINGAIICANSEDGIKTKLNDTGQSSMIMNVSEEAYFHNMNMENSYNQIALPVNRNGLNQKLDRNLTSNASQTNYPIHNTGTPKGTQPFLVNDVSDGLSQNWNECVPTLPFSDNVNWQDKLQRELMYSNARAMSQPVRPDSIEYGSARNHDT